MFELTTTSFIAILFLTILGSYISKRLSNNNLESIFFKKIFLISFIFRILLMFAFYFVLEGFFPEHNTFITGSENDEAVYDKNGIEIADAWRKGYSPPGYLLGSLAYNYLNAIIYFLFGHNIFLVRMLGVFVGSLIPILVYKISEYSYNDIRVAKIASILTAFLPVLLLYSVMQLKEVHVIFSSVFIIWGLMKLRTKLNVLLIIAIVFMWIYLIFLRFYYGYIILASSLIYIIINRSVKYRAITIITFVIASIISMILLSNLGLAERFGFIKNVIGYLSFKSEEHYVGTSETNVFYSAVKKGGGILVIPINIIYSFFMPYPLWILCNPRYTIRFSTWPFLVATIAWYILTPFCIYGFICSFKGKNNEKLFLILIILSTLAMLAMSSQGVITAGRTKDTIMPFLMIFGSLGITRYIKRQTGIQLFVLLYIFLQYGGGLLYIFMRMSSLGLVFISSSLFVAVLTGLTILLKYSSISFKFIGKNKFS